VRAETAVRRKTCLAQANGDLVLGQVIVFIRSKKRAAPWEEIQEFEKSE
jgi:hypothetical protein